MHAVQDNAHALPRRDKSCDADEPAKEGEHAPWAACGAERNNQVCKEANPDSSNPKTTCKYDARSVAIADGPSNEVWMRLSAEGVFYSCGNNPKRGRMGRVL